MNTEYHGFMLLYLLVNRTYSRTRNQEICIPKTTRSMTPCTFTSRWHQTLIIVVLFIATVCSKHLHVRSTTSTITACTQSASCYTLQELLQHSSHYFLSHTIITFQSGYHEVNYSYNVLVRNVRNITLLGDVHDHSVIQCTGAFGLSFMNVINLTISNLNFYLCGALIPKQYSPTMYAAKLL